MLEETTTVDNVIKFVCTNNNYGQQVLVFTNSEINVILRNQKEKTIRNHNSDEKQDIKYKITIEKL